jgi:hypothetical protein
MNMAPSSVSEFRSGRLAPGPFVTGLAAGQQ